MSWLSEYRSSLKNVHAEEFLDVYLYRPIAFVIVKTLYALPLTPNNYSFFSFAAGMTAAWKFYQGSFQWGAFFFFLFAVLDCCDGMQARMKKNGSEFGRFVDGLVDYVSNAFCYIGLAFGVAKAMPMIGPFPTSYLIIAAGVSKALHSITYDHFLMEYLSYDRGDGGFVQREMEEIRAKIAAAEVDPNGSKRRLLILKIYLAFTSLQAGNEGRTLKFDSKEYIAKNYRSIQMWGLIGPAWHITFLVLAFLINRPEWLFGYAIIFGNIWLLVMLAYQHKLSSDLESKGRVA
ncbi:MAG: CDP-alcohol phosphatidyltransferase family protein [Bdellovibrionales bacterium]|nr:CDP-alcohol phosphatidyltransferase family protein [Bdellovibrionales bacterium]